MRLDLCGAPRKACMEARHDGRAAPLARIRPSSRPPRPCIPAFYHAIVHQLTATHTQAHGK
eukprot:365387-Chlamydomonas_euryale.AAC.15